MPERIIEIGTKKYSQVVCLDEPGAGGACHQYAVTGEFAHVQFQNGPVKEAGVNGCHQEDLLVIVIDRLAHFQAGEYACLANAQALAHCLFALEALRERTTAREQRGVEGTSVK